MALTSQNTAMLKKFQNFREHGPGLDIDARILEFSEFFEHYRVSRDWGLEILDFFEHYSVSCTPCPMIHECVGRANLEIWNLETYVLQKAGNQEIQTLETSRHRSSGGGVSIYIYIYIYIYKGLSVMVLGPRSHGDGSSLIGLGFRIWGRKGCSVKA